MTLLVIVLLVVLGLGAWLWARRLDRRTKPTTGAEAMIGETGEVVQACRPTGMVQLRGELWEARCEEGADVGETVRVESLDGLTLVVVR